MLLWVPEHAGAHAELALLQFQYVVVYATLASTPESLIIGQLVETYGHIAQVGVHLHHGITAGQGEYLGMWPAQTGQSECIVLDVACHTQPLIVGVHNQARGGNIVLVAPGLYVTETGKAVSVQSQNGLALLYLGGKIFVGTLGNTGTTLACSLAYRLQNLVYILLVTGICNDYPDVAILECTLFFLFFHRSSFLTCASLIEARPP